MDRLSVSSPEVGPQPSYAPGGQQFAAPTTPLRKRRRNLVVVLGVAVVAATAGWVGGLAIAAPIEVQQNVAGKNAAPVTVPVEYRVLQATVVTRGDVRARTAVNIDAVGGIDPTSLAAITGRVPVPGEMLGEGAVAIEVSGRPVILLRGDLPAYRALRLGSVGPDVAQLEKALARLGYFRFTPDSIYDGKTAGSVSALYRALGYSPAGPSADETQRIAAAQDALVAAKRELQRATFNLQKARQPPPRSQVLAAQGAVAQATTAYSQAMSDRDAAIATGATPAQIADLNAQVDEAANWLAIVQAQLAELTAPPDLTPFHEAVTAASDQVTTTEAALNDLKMSIGVWLPRGEVAFAPSLPLKVQVVNVTLGAIPTDTMVKLVGPDVQVTTSVSGADARLLKVGDAVQLDGQGQQLTGTVTSVANVPGTSGVDLGRYAVIITPSNARRGLSDTNLRVTIPIRSTKGKVLVVPLSALVTAEDGTTTVRLLAGRESIDISVSVGLSSQGYAEVTPIDGRLGEGDQVVVGSW